MRSHICLVAAFEEKLKETQFAINGKNMLFQPLPDRKATPSPILAIGANKGAGKGKSKDLGQIADPITRSGYAFSAAAKADFCSTIGGQRAQADHASVADQIRGNGAEDGQDSQDVKESFTKTLDKAMRDQTNYLMQSMEALLRGRPSCGLGADGSNANKRAKIPGSDRHLEFCRYYPSDWGSQSSSGYALPFLGLSQQGAMRRGTAAIRLYHFIFSGSLACAKSFAFYHDYVHISIRRAFGCLLGRDISYFRCFAAGPNSCRPTDADPGCSTLWICERRADRGDVGTDLAPGNQDVFGMTNMS